MAFFGLLSEGSIPMETIMYVYLVDEVKNTVGYKINTQSRME